MTENKKGKEVVVMQLNGSYNLASRVESQFARPSSSVVISTRKISVENLVALHLKKGRLLSELLIKLLNNQVR